MRCGEPATDVYPTPVGAQFLYPSADPDRILGWETVTLDDTTFHVGFTMADAG